MFDVWMFSECVEESVCDCAAEVSREAANGPRELQANQLVVRVGQDVGANDARLDSRVNNRMNEAQHGFRGECVEMRERICARE